MENIYLTSEEIKNLNKVCKHNYGCNGECFLYKDGVVKLFYNELPFYLKDKIDNDIKRSSNIILWPRKKVFKVNKKASYMAGYFMDKAPNISLLDLKNKIISQKTDISFDDFLRVYYDNFLSALKKEEIYMVDIKLAHVFIDDNFYFIDTDGYFEKDDNFIFAKTDQAKPYDYNLKEINRVLALFMDCIMGPNIMVYKDEDLSKESFLYDAIFNARKLTKTNSFMKLSNYKRR